MCEDRHVQALQGVGSSRVDHNAGVVCDIVSGSTWESLELIQSWTSDTLGGLARSYIQCLDFCVPVVSLRLCVPLCMAYLS